MVALNSRLDEARAVGFRQEIANVTGVGNDGQRPFSRRRILQMLRDRLSYQRAQRFFVHQRTVYQASRSGWQVTSSTIPIIAASTAAAHASRIAATYLRSRATKTRPRGPRPFANALERT